MTAPFFVQDLYIDTEASEMRDCYNNFDVMIPRPIIVKDDERAYICMKDFMIMNSIYNISADLGNNAYTIKITSRTYSRTPLGNITPYLNAYNYFFTSGTEVDKPINNTQRDGIKHTETLIPSGQQYAIVLYNDAIITTDANYPNENSSFNNIFKYVPSTTTYMTFSADDYLVFYDYYTPENGVFLYNLQVRLENYASGMMTPTSPVQIAIQVWHSVDGITFYENQYSSTNVITYNTNEWSSVNVKDITIGLVAEDTYQYHKVRFYVSGLSSASEFKTRIKFRQIYLSKYDSYNETYDEGIQNWDLTIEDGCYSLTNLMSFFNYYLKVFVNANLSFTTAFATTPFLSAQNKIYLSWALTEPYFVYSPTSQTDDFYKVEFLFNPVLNKMLGFGTQVLSLLKTDITTSSPYFVNLMNFKKILIASSLQLTTKPYTFLNKTYTKRTGIGDVILWVSKDISPFSYINWSNPTDYKIEINDKLINKINFKILNEYGQVLNNIPSCAFHIQIVKEKK